MIYLKIRLASPSGSFLLGCIRIYECNELEPVYSITRFILKTKRDSENEKVWILALLAVTCLVVSIVLKSLIICG